LTDHAGAPVVFTEVILARTPIARLDPSSQPPLAQFTCEAVFLAPSAIEELAQNRRNWLRTHIVGSKLFKIEDLPSTLKVQRKPADLCILANYLIRYFHEAIASNRTDSDVGDRLRHDITTNILYHEIAGHYLHSMEGTQIDFWNPSAVTVAEARAVLSEIAFGEIPLLGLETAFHRFEDREPEGTKVLELLLASGDKMLPLNDAWPVAEFLVQLSDADLRAKSLEALKALGSLKAGPGSSATHRLECRQFSPPTEYTEYHEPMRGRESEVEEVKLSEGEKDQLKYRIGLSEWESLPCWKRMFKRKPLPPTGAV